MNKFVGLVNGKSFDNEKDFKNAVDEAVKNLGDAISISSYYRYIPDDETEEPKVVDDPKFVSTYEYFLGGRKPETETEEGIEYKVSDELKSRLEEASNRDDIKKSLIFHLNKLRDNVQNEKRHIKYIQEKIESYQKDIEKETKELNEQNDTLKDLNARDVYYTTLLNIVEEAEVKEEKVDEKKKKEDEPVNEAGPSNEFENKEEVKKRAYMLLGMSAFDFLKQLGFVK